MSNSKYHDEILSYITEHGESGVNALAKALNIPLSTMQKTLENQSYFKKTERRKWDLPENVNADIKSDTLTLMLDSVENSLLLLNAQLSDIQQTVQGSLIPLGTLKRGITTIKAPIAPVAGSLPDIDPELLKIDIKTKELYAVFKKFINKVPEEYKDLLKNVDLCRLIIEKGTDYLNGEFNTELTTLFLEMSTVLSDDVASTLKQYQKGE